MRSFVTLLSIFVFISSTCRAEKLTVSAKGAAEDYGYSTPLELKQGDSVQAVFLAGTNARIIVTVDGEDYVSGTGLVVAGPASLKVRAQAGTSAFATFELERAGTASPPAGIPIENGTNYKVILEASSDLVNWTAVNPGLFASGAPQRFFRVRLVKQ